MTRGATMTAHPAYTRVVVTRSGADWGSTGADEAAALAGARTILGLAPSKPMAHRYQVDLTYLTVEAWNPKRMTPPAGTVITTHGEEQTWVDDYRPDYYGFAHAVTNLIPADEDEDLSGADFVQDTLTTATFYHVHPAQTV